MYRKIIVGYEGSDQSEDALALGRVLAETTGAQLVLAGVVAEDPLTGGIDHAFREVDELVHQIEQAGQRVGAESLAVPGRSPVRGLYELAERAEADLLVVGSSHRAEVGQAIAGTVGQRLLHGAPCAVAIAPQGFRNSEPRLRVIGVGYDGQEEAKQALAAAIMLGEKARATLQLFVAADPPPIAASGFPAAGYREASREGFQAALQEALDATPAELRASGQLLDGRVAAALKDEAEKGVDLLCIGSRGYGPLRRVLLGSVSSELIKSSPCALLIVPRGVHETSIVDEPQVAAASKA